MGKYMRESGRIRSQEASFNFEMGGDPDPKHVVECLHGWYRIEPRKKRDVCVKCSKPRAECELELEAREQARQANIRRAQEEDSRAGIDAFGGSDAGGRAAE